MTPQLQQAIRLLQLSSLELQTEIQQAMESNMMLELEEEESESGGEPEAADESEGDEPDLSLQDRDTLPDDLAVDSGWDDIYEPPASGPAPSADDERDFQLGDTADESLAAHLGWQLQMTLLSERDITIGEAIIDAINQDGYLSLQLEDIRAELPPDLEVEADEVEAVLHAIQNFDPPGVAARDLRDSLLLQLRQLDPQTALLPQARRLIADYFDLLAGRDYNRLKRKLKMNDEQLGEVIHLIQSLNPRPGGQISDQRPEYIVPDVIVKKAKGRWRVELNPDSAPRLRINAKYADMIKQVRNNSDSTSMKNHLQEARWFLKSLQSRNETLLKVATSIVERQKGFLEHGEVAMKALVLHDIAQEVDMHESTISRVTTRKYMHTPRGIFELKYFFSSHVNTAGGGECSSTAIRALIKKLVAEENPSKPLSDSKIANVLSEQGINVARRTVAKYRESLAISPSNERKRLA